MRDNGKATEAEAVSWSSK